MKVNDLDDFIEWWAEEDDEWSDDAYWRILAEYFNDEYNRHVRRMNDYESLKRDLKQQEH